MFIINFITFLFVQQCFIDHGVEQGARKVMIQLVAIKLF